MQGNQSGSLNNAEKSLCEQYRDYNGWTPGEIADALLKERSQKYYEGLRVEVEAHLKQTKRKDIYG